MYDSSQIIQIYQDDPPEWRKQSFRLKGWTDTISGYEHEADKLSRCILRNRKLMGRNYTWAVAINIEKELSPADITSVWTKVCRKLREKGIVALWVREPSRSNRCNYHLVVKNDITRVALGDAFEKSMPDRSELPYHKHIRPIDSQYHYARYITKAKTRGYVRGRQVADKYGNKRLLFQPRLNLRKYDRIGDFWVKPKSRLWQDIIDIEKQIAEGLEKPNIKRLAKYVYEMLGEYVPLHKIERSYGYSADTPAIKDW
jgi:hypothetical protein